MNDNETPITDPQEAPFVLQDISDADAIREIFAAAAEEYIADTGLSLNAAFKLALNLRITKGN